MKLPLIATTLLVLLTASIPAFAEDPADAPIAVSGGYTLLREAGTNGNGWYGDVSKRIGSIPGFSIAGEISTIFANKTFFVSGTGIDADATAFVYWAGPRYFFKMPKGSTVLPFANFLVGGFNTNLHASSISGGSLNTASATESGFAYAVGGGLDFVVSKSIAIRVRPEFAHSGGSDPANDFRFSTGFVWRPTH